MLCYEQIETLKSAREHVLKPGRTKNNRLLQYFESALKLVS